MDDGEGIKYMYFKIGGALFIGGGSKYHLKSGIQGLDSPAIRTGDGVYAGRDGGFVSGHFYGQRTIVIPGFYVGNDCEDAMKLRRDLLGYMRIRYALPIFIQDFDGNFYYTEGFVKDVKATLDRPTAGDFQITILCPDPILYYGGDGTDVSSIYTEVDLTYNGTTTVNNAGNVPSYPIITLTGLIENPVISNDTTTQSLGVEVTNTQATDVLMIDMANRIITKNGTTINSSRTTTSSWWNLLSENNDISLTATSGTLTSAKIKFKKGYAGI